MRHFLAKTSILLLLAGVLSAPGWANSENSHRQIMGEAWQVINRSFAGVLLGLGIMTISVNAQPESPATPTALPKVTNLV